MPLRSTVAARLEEKAALLRRGDQNHRHIRPAIMFDAGGMCGIFGKGVALGFEQLGLTPAFHAIIGSSAGACNAAYFAAGQAALASTVYLDDLTTGKFFSWGRLPVMDIGYLARVFKTTKRLDVERLRNSVAPVLASVTCADTGTGRYLDLREHEDPVRVLAASMAMPLLYGRSVTVGNGRYVDGQVSLPLAVDKVIAMTSPTDLVVVLNHHIDHRVVSPGWRTRAALSFLLPDAGGLRGALLRCAAIRNANAELIQAVHRGQYRGVNIEVISPEEGGVSRTTCDKKKLERFLQHGVNRVINLFQGE